MAITVHLSPTQYSPAYNPLVSVVSSSNSGQPNFRYVFDIYSSAATSILARVKLPARPTDTRGMFDAKRVLESLVTFDLPNPVESAAWYRNTNSYERYVIKYGEEYGTTPTIYPDLQNSGTAYIWNAALSHAQYLDYAYFDYWIIGGLDSNLLSNQPTTHNIQLEQGAWMYAMTGNANAIKYGVIKKYNSAGALLGTLTITNPYAALSADADQWVRFACGTRNIESYSPGWLTSNVAYYTVHIEDNTNAISSLVYTYNITDNCQYETIRLHFLNTRGGFDSFNFNKKSIERKTVTREGYRKRYGSTSGTTWAYTLAERGNTTFYTEENQSFTANSDWISEAESIWLGELIASPEVYQESGGVLIAIDILNSEHQVMKKVNQKLFNLSVSFKYSNNNTKQRG